jgi:hypothetical protein
VPAIHSQCNTRSQSSRSLFTSLATFSLKPSTIRAAGSPSLARSGSNSSPKIFPVASASPSMLCVRGELDDQDGVLPGAGHRSSFRVPMSFLHPVWTPECPRSVPTPGSSARRKVQPAPLAVQVGDRERVGLTVDLKLQFGVLVIVILGAVRRGGEVSRKSAETPSRLAKKSRIPPQVAG